MITQINPKQAYRYIGAGDGKGAIHYVTDISKRTVTTWSEPSPKSDEGGWSWHGSMLQFTRDFEEA